MCIKIITFSYRVSTGPGSHEDVNNEILFIENDVDLVIINFTDSLVFTYKIAEK